MQPKESPDYLAICQYVGQLFLETRHQLEALARRAERAERERDEAVAAIVKANRSD